LLSLGAEGPRTRGQNRTRARPMDDRPAAPVRIISFSCYLFALFDCSIAAATTASTVKPNFFTSFCRGADSPKVLICGAWERWWRNGERQRIRAEKDKPGERTIFYVGYLDGLANGYAENNRMKEVRRWKARGGNN